MSQDNDKPEATPNAEASPSHDDLLSAGAVMLPELTVWTQTEDVAGADGVTLRIEELLVSDSDGVAVEGGFLLLDGDAAMAGAAVQQVFDFSGFGDGAANLNSLLGLAGPEATNPT